MAELSLPTYPTHPEFYRLLLFSSRKQKLKFIYFEKAAKFSEIFTLLLTTVHTVKSKVKISQNFVAFSECMNFNSKYFFFFFYQAICHKYVLVGIYFLVPQVLLVIFATFFPTYLCNIFSQHMFGGFFPNIFFATFFRIRIYLYFSQNFFKSNPSKNSTFFEVLMIWSHHLSRIIHEMSLGKVFCPITFKIFSATSASNGSLIE